MQFIHSFQQVIHRKRLIREADSTDAGHLNWGRLDHAFMNVFFRQEHHQSDPVIGSLFAWGSLAMGVGLLLAPPLADRMGKIQLVVVTQTL